MLGGANPSRPYIRADILFESRLSCSPEEKDCKYVPAAAGGSYRLLGGSTSQLDSIQPRAGKVRMRSRQG